ncbi:GntR family transcriptional regulator [Limoniibacter endophyticus]|uniref:GntR family transcriptional regulator n=1 Tax=Limoniibacter endophyticus TaxID=1565040 RepID=A0A8J3DQJ1_9HYPH|nr:GntR family transcriptional regulator [Limoniibacter endophyticus]GHC72273.1 GntR family transcriptional regulator [Limoniibacter endophyticus]
MAGATLSKVSTRFTLQDGVYEQLQQALMWGQFEPSQAITISSLASEFGTSHMPVREALRRLAAEKALEIGSNGSARVPAVSRENLDDICLARLSLEGTATEEAAKQATVEQINTAEALSKEHARLGDAGDVLGMLRKNQEFHFAVYEMSGSKVLHQLILMLWLRFGPYMRLLSDHVEREIQNGKTDDFERIHRQIITALREGDAKRARAMMREDIQTTRDLIRTLLTPAGSVMRG